MVFKLLKKLVVPGLSLLVFFYINNNIDFINQYFVDPVVNYAYYLSGIGVWLTIAWILSIIVNVVIWDEFFRHRQGIEPPDVIETLTFIAILILALMGIVGVVFDQSITGIWAMASVAGGVIGFALKDMIAAFFTGIAINLDNTFRVGDWITITDERGKKVTGWIEEITWRTTRIGQQDGSTLIYPNNIISNQALRNLTIDGPERRYSITFTIDPAIETKKVIRILTAAVRSVEGILEKPKPTAVIDGVTGRGIDYEVRYWVNPEKLSPRKAKNLIMYSALHHLKQANIPLFSQSDQYIAAMPERYVDLDRQRDRIIEKVPSLHSCLNRREIDHLAHAMQRHELKEGTKIIHQGDAGDSLFILAEGVLNVRIHSHENNTDLQVGQIYPGEFFGEHSLMTGEPRTATVIASSDCIVYEITREHLNPILKARPALAELFSQVIAERDLLNTKAFETYSMMQRKNEASRLQKSLFQKIKGFFGINTPSSNGDSSSFSKIQK